MSYEIETNSTLSYVKYYPHLHVYFKSDRTPLLIAKLEYWFSKEKFRNGFFKFLEPCPHRLCKKGDTWAEELGWKRDLFKSIFDRVGTRYTSKTAYLKAIQESDPFKGKLYISYYDRKTNRTFFLRNHSFVDQLFKNMMASFTTTPAKKDIIPQEKTCQSPRVKPVDSQLLTQYSTQDFPQSPIYKQKNTNKYSMPKEKPANHKSDCSEKIEERMIEIWEKFVGVVPNYFKNSRAIQKLGQILKASFEGSLDKWQEYCRKIASSKFLMGEGTSTFKAWIYWAIKPETVARIRDNGFTLGDRPIPLDKTEENLRRQNQQRLAQLFENLSEAGRDLLRQNYLQEIETVNPAMAYTIRTSGWTDPFIAGAFKSFALKSLMRGGDC